MSKEDTINEYYHKTRKEILPLLPDKVSRVLEIGCGTGNTLVWLKNLKHCNLVCGIDISHTAAEIARKKLGLVYAADIEKIDLPFSKDFFDLILCLDVLEHLIDPWAVVSKLYNVMAPDGILIASIPNVRHFRVVFPLIFQGKWQYTDEGILDRTHLRFFVIDTAIELLELSGLQVEQIIGRGIDGGKTKLFNVLTWYLFKSFFEGQYLIRAKKSA